MSVDKTLVCVHLNESFLTSTLALSCSIDQPYKDFLCFSLLIKALCVFRVGLIEPRFRLWEPGIK